MWKKVLILAFLTVLLRSISIPSALGKDYPTKPIEILVPYTPGGGADTTTRLTAEVVTRLLGQPITVVTKPGAGGSIAAADVISSKPDGYKLVMLTNIFFATTTKIQKIPFNPSDLIPIANAMEMRAGMLVRSDSPYKTLADLLDYARKSPGKLRWAHAGRGISVHMNAALIFRKAGVETIDVPYKGAPEILTALLGGHVDAITQTHGSIVGNVEAGSVRYLVFYSDRRYRDFPNVPCAAELGFTEVGKLATFFGYYAHKDTPEKIKETLVDAFGKVCEDPGFRKGIEKIGEEPNCGGPEFLKKAIKEAEEIGVPMLKELGLYVGK